MIDRALVLWSNPGDVVLTPFMGVGSEVYGAVRAGRKGVGIELKPTYFKQAVKNIEAAETGGPEFKAQTSLELEDDDALAWAAA